jgi:hypothetical protein
MPIYKLRNNHTGEEWEELMSISEMEERLENHPHVELLINGAPMVTGTMGKNSHMGKKKILDSTSVTRPYLDSTGVK